MRGVITGKNSNAHKRHSDSVCKRFSQRPAFFVGFFFLPCCGFLYFMIHLFCLHVELVNSDLQAFVRGYLQLFIVPPPLRNTSALRSERLRHHQDFSLHLQSLKGFSNVCHMKVMTPAHYEPTCQEAEPQNTYWTPRLRGTNGYTQSPVIPPATCVCACEDDVKFVKDEEKRAHQG